MHKFYSPWCSLLQHVLDRKKLSQSRFAELVGTQQQTIHAYVMGRTKPPIDDLKVWADALQLVGSERQNFLWLALETYTPSTVWEKVNHLTQILSQAEASLADARAEVNHLRVEVGNLRAEAIGAGSHHGYASNKPIG